MQYYQYLLTGVSSGICYEANRILSTDSSYSTVTNTILHNNQIKSAYPANTTTYPNTSPEESLFSISSPIRGNINSTPGTAVGVEGNPLLGNGINGSGIRPAWTPYNPADLAWTGGSLFGAVKVRVIIIIFLGILINI